MGAHGVEIDRHPDSHEEEREQQAAERLDVGGELVAIARFGEQHAGQECAERHRHADGLHQECGAEHHQQRRCGHHLARAGVGQQPKQRIEEIAPGDHQGRNGDCDLRHRRERGEKVAAMAGPARRDERQERDQRDNRHVLEQQDGERALAVGLVEIAALVEDLQRDRGRRQGERKACDRGLAPAEQAGRHAEPADCDRGQGQLGGAETENRAPHREQAGELELEADQEQQQHDPDFGDRQDGLRRVHDAETPRPDHHAGGEIGNDRREP